MKQIHLPAKISDQQRLVRVFEHVGVKILRTVDSRLTGAPVVTGIGVAVIRVGWKKFVVVARIKCHGHHDLFAVAQTRGALCALLCP